MAKHKELQGTTPIKRAAKKKAAADNFPSADASNTLTFTVAAGHIINDPNGAPGTTVERYYGGDTIDLTKAQAEHLMKRGAINVELPDFGTPSDGDKAETGSGDTLEGERDEASGGVPAGDAAPEKGKTSPRRKAAPL